MQLRPPRELGLILRARRKELGLGQEALVERAGVSRQWVVEIEGGKDPAELGLVLRLMRVLALQIDVRTRDGGQPLP